MTHITTFVKWPASFSISNYIWDTSKLFLLSADVKINPGPRPTDRSPVFSTICSRKINRGPQQDMAPASSNENCSACYHQACNGLLVGQTPSYERFWPFYHLEMSAIWLWNRRSYHLLQFMSNQIDPLLLENLAPIAGTLSTLVLLI